MKLRILGNSIRLRLTQTEIRNLAEGHAVKEVTSFGPNNFLEYKLSLTDSLDIRVGFQSGKIFVEIPETIGIPWAKGTQISLQGKIQVEEGTVLSVLIEKDFKCKTERVGENEEDMFPNPSC